MNTTSSNSRVNILVKTLVADPDSFLWWPCGAWIKSLQVSEVKIRSEGKTGRLGRAGVLR